MKRLIRLIISILSIMVLLAGCGSADAASATDTSAPEEENTAVTEANGDSSGDASENASESTEIDNDLSIWPKNYTKEEYADKKSSLPGPVSEEVPVIDGSVELEVLADAVDKEGISYLWLDLLNNVIGTDPVLVLNDLDKMEIDPSYKTDNGTGLGPFYCINCFVTDKYGNMKNINFHLYWENHLTANATGTDSAESDIHVGRGDRIELSVDVSADDMSGIKYYWLWLDEQNHKAKRFLNLNEDTCLTDPIEGDCVYEVRIRDQFMNWRSVRFNIYVDQ